MTSAFSLKKAGGFTLGSGSVIDPVFSDDGRLLAVQTEGTSRVTVWDVVSQSKLAVCRFTGLSGAFGLTLSGNGKRIAMRADDRLEVLDTDTGERVLLLNKSNYQTGEEQQLDSTGRLLFDASSGVEAAFTVWETATGKRLEHYPINGKACAFSSINRSINDNVLVCVMGKYESGVRDMLWLWSDGKLKKIDLDLSHCIAAISPDGKTIFIAGQREQGCSFFRLLDCDGNLRIEKAMGDVDTFPRTPRWRPDGRQIAWNDGLANKTAWLLDANTLEITQTLHWLEIDIAFGCDGLLAIAGKKGIVIPQIHATQASEEIGKLEIARAELARWANEQHPYHVRRLAKLLNEFAEENNRILLSNAQAIEAANAVHLAACAALEQFKIHKSGKQCCDDWERIRAMTKDFNWLYQHAIGLGQVMQHRI
jgi:WD40 repeat protein